MREDFQPDFRDAELNPVDDIADPGRGLRGFAESTGVGARYVYPDLVDRQVGEFPDAGAH